MTIQHDPSKARPHDPLRVAQVMLSPGFGGAERLFVDLCHALPAYDVEVLAVCHPDFAGHHLAANLPGVEVAAVAARGVWDLRARSRLRAALARFRPALVHTHLARGAHLGAAAAATLGIPVAANLHNYVKLKHYRGVERFVPGSEDQRRYLHARGVPDARIEVIPHFSRLPARAAPPAFAPGPPSFAALGRFVHKKGFDVLIEALHRLRRGGLAATLRLGGAGPEEARLRSQVRHLGLGEAVAFAGWVEDVPAFLSRGEIFVLPSRDEPFGIVVLEAMACGAAIVSTRTQGPQEILDESVAWWAQPGDAESLARAMAAAADPHARRERAARALARYRERYTAAAVVPRFIDLYRRLAAGATAIRP